MRFLCLIALSLAAAFAVPAAGADGSTNIFLLRQTDRGPVVDAVPIAANEMKAFHCNHGGQGPIDVIFPPSAGRSASLIQIGDGCTIVVRHTGAALQVESRAADGSRREYPPREIEDLARYDIRVNISGPEQRAAFVIEQYDRVRRDVGPVCNMFAGSLPPAMLANAIIVETDTYLHSAGPPVSGVVPLELDRWPFVKVTLPDGTTSDFIVDVGAASTVIDRSLLPEEIEIGAASVVEYSNAGKRTLKYAPGGATGQVQTVLGHVDLDHIRLGGLEVPDVALTVLEEVPDLFGRPVGGILGMDVLRRAEVLTLSRSKDKENQWALAFGDSGGAKPMDAVEVPFALASTHLIIESACNGTPVFFVLDSGAPTTFLDAQAAGAVGVKGDESARDQAHGLDAGSVDMLPGVIETVTLDGRSFRNVECRIAALSAFNSLRAPQQHVGLLGVSFFSRFDRIEIDFVEHVVRFVG
ncbi:MAG: aspartyl protease family protein [Planctomycetota bacterium]|jgi:predicted aspartyl protease